jgi:hypothetical protein
MRANAKEFRADLSDAFLEKRYGSLHPLLLLQACDPLRADAVGNIEQQVSDPDADADNQDCEQDGKPAAVTRYALRVQPSIGERASAIQPRNPAPRGYTTSRSTKAALVSSVIR